MPPAGGERDHIVARSVRDASQAYWLYLAAHEQLRTHIESADQRSTVWSKKRRS